MQRSLCAYLQDILDAGQFIRTFSGGMSFEMFESSEVVRSAVERKFEIIGEALRQASRLYPGSVSSIPDLKDAIDQRNHIAHGYFDVDAKILWSTIYGELGLLEDEVSRLKAANNCTA